MPNVASLVPKALLSVAGMVPEVRGAEIAGKIGMSVATNVAGAVAGEFVKKGLSPKGQDASLPAASGQISPDDMAMVMALSHEQAAGSGPAGAGGQLGIAPREPNVG